MLVHRLRQHMRAADVLHLRIHVRDVRAAPRPLAGWGVPGGVVVLGSHLRDPADRRRGRRRNGRVSGIGGPGPDAVTTTSGPPTGRARRTPILCAVAAALLLAVAVLPGLVAEWTGRSAGVTVSGLPGLVGRGFDRWVGSGAAQPAADLAAAVRFWEVFHLVKAVAATALLVVLVLLQGRIWARHAATESRGRRILLAVAGVVAALLTAVTILVAIANLQGAVAPLSSVLSFLPAATPTPAMATVRDQVSAGAATPMLATLIGDFRTYHAVVVGGAALTLAGLAAAAVIIWIRWSRLPGDGRRRHILIGAELSVIAMAVFIGLVLLANLSTVADPAPALSSFYGAGA